MKGDVGMRIQLPPLWGNIIAIIFCLPFLYQCYFIVKEDGNYMGFVICLIPMIIMGNSIRNMYRIIKRRRMGIDDFEAVDDFDHHFVASNEKQRLRKLEDLYQSHLISKEEYEEKRKEIIRNL